MTERVKEIRVIKNGDLVITTNRAEILIPPHLPLKKSRLSEEILKEIVSYCQLKERVLLSTDSRGHTEVTKAIKEAAPDIYQSLFLTRNEDRNKIHAFSEVWLNNEKVDCLILGPFGSIIVEVKPLGIPAQEKLESSKHYWQELFPKVPIITLKAGYRGNKITFSFPSNS